MSKIDPRTLQPGDFFYFYEAKKGKEKHKYRLASVIALEPYFIVAQVYAFGNKNKPTYRTCFNYSSIACGEITIEDHVSEKETADAADTIADM